jgi:hypothetical protein
MRELHLGVKGSFSLLVQPEHLADRFKDAILPPALATPVMIMVMENADQGLSRSCRRGCWPGRILCDATSIEINAGSIRSQKVHMALLKPADFALSTN